MPRISYPSFAAILDEILAHWPAHEKYLRINLAKRQPALLAHSEGLSGIVLQHPTVPA